MKILKCQKDTAFLDFIMALTMHELPARVFFLPYLPEA
jgi:hypothetical protein